MKRVFLSPALAMPLLGLLLCPGASQSQGKAELPDQCEMKCPMACCPVICIKKCAAVPDTQKHSHPVFSCKAVDFCLKECSCLCKHGCWNCCVKCGKPRTKKVLLKKFVTAEKCGVKCEVTQEIMKVQCSPSK